MSLAALTGHLSPPHLGTLPDRLAVPSVAPFRLGSLIMEHRRLVLQICGNSPLNNRRDLKVHFLFEGVVAELRVPAVISRSTSKGELRAAAAVIRRVGSVLIGRPVKRRLHTAAKL